MRSVQNQLDRFSSIAKKLVDDHSAELFTRSAINSTGRQSVTNDAYYNHLNSLGKELNEKAESFIFSFKKVNDEVKAEIRTLCKKYLNQFIRRNQPDMD